MCVCVDSDEKLQPLKWKQMSALFSVEHITFASSKAIHFVDSYAVSTHTHTNTCKSTSASLEMYGSSPYQGIAYPL